MKGDDIWEGLAPLARLLGGTDGAGRALAAKSVWDYAAIPLKERAGWFARLFSFQKAPRPKMTAPLAGAITRAQGALARRNLARLLPLCLGHDVRSAPAALGSVSPRAAAWGAALWLFRTEGAGAVRLLREAADGPFFPPDTAADCLAVHLLLEEIVAALSQGASLKEPRMAGGLRTGHFLTAFPETRTKAWLGKDIWAQAFLWFASHSPLTQLVYADLLPQPSGVHAAAVTWPPGASQGTEQASDWKPWWLSLVARSLVAALASKYSGAELESRGPGLLARKRTRDQFDQWKGGEKRAHQAARAALLAGLGENAKTAPLYGRVWELLIRSAIATKSPAMFDDIIGERGALGQADDPVLQEIASRLRGNGAVDLQPALRRCQEPFAPANATEGSCEKDLENFFTSKLPLPVAERSTAQIRELVGAWEAALSRPQTKPAKASA